MARLKVGQTRAASIAARISATARSIPTMIARLTIVSPVTLKWNPVSVAITVSVAAILFWRHVNPGILVLLGGTAYLLLHT